MITDYFRTPRLQIMIAVITVAVLAVAVLWAIPHTCGRCRRAR